jgi:hypothetical protein
MKIYIGPSRIFSTRFGEPDRNTADLNRAVTDQLTF